MGTPRSTHPVAGDRRRVLGRVLLIVALASALLLALMFVIDLGGAQYALIFAAFPFLLAAPMSVILLRKARTPELIELHDDGIAHVLGDFRRSWTWDQVRAIDVAERGEYAYTGSDLDCTIRFADGRLLRFNGLTENSGVLVGALRTHCPAATREPVRRKYKARAAAILGTITLVGGGVAAWAFATVPGTPDGGDQFGLAMLGVACVVPAVISLILLISVLVTGRR